MAQRWTQKGRVVYNRKKHFFSLKDINRILKSFQEEAEGEELDEEQLELSLDIINYLVFNNSSNEEKARQIWMKGVRAVFPTLIADILDALSECSLRKDAWEQLTCVGTKLWNWIQKIFLDLGGTPPWIQSP